MNGQGNNNGFRPTNPGQPQVIRPLSGDAGLHITQVFTTPSSHFNNFFNFYKPGQYNISLRNDVPGRSQANPGQLTRNVPTTNESVTPTSAGPFGMFSAGVVANSTKIQGGSTPAVANGNGNQGNGFTSPPPTQRNGITSLPPTQRNGFTSPPPTQRNEFTSPPPTQRPASAQESPLVPVNAASFAGKFRPIHD